MPDESSGIIPAGTLFMLSYGEYDDYCIQGIFRACANIDVTAVQAEFLRQHPEQAKDYEFSPSAFVAWLRDSPGTDLRLLLCLKVWLRVRNAIAGQPDFAIAETGVIVNPSEGGSRSGGRCC